jgi:hypothetical protein
MLIPKLIPPLVTNYLDSSVTVIDLLTNRSVIIPVVRYPLDVAFNTIDNRAVVLCDKDKKLLLLDLNTNKIIKTYSLPRHPKSVAVNSIRNIAIVADDEEDGLTIIPLPISPSLPKIKITSPMDNAQISSTTVNVTGTVENSTNVTVNGITASVSGNTFSATLTLKAGMTTIAAVATDKYGRKACDNIMVDIVTGIITGTVTNAATAWLLPLAIVSITDAKGYNQTIATIISGTFTAEIAAGAYTGTVIKPWYFPYSFSGSVAVGGTSEINIPLVPSPPAISNITVTDITENSAKINWTTDQLTVGSVQYGKTTAYGAVASDSVEETTYSITLANLSPATNYHFRVTAASDNGTSVVSNDGTFKTIGHIDIAINSPSAGTSINSNSVIVTGSIANPSNVETGVTVNGIAASLINNQFAVNNIPLTAGQNIITITATDANGNTATKSITVNATAPDNYIKLSANYDSGIAPLGVTLTINGSFSVTNPIITSTGPGAVDQLQSTNTDEYKYNISSEGVYYFTAQAIGPDGNTYSDTMAVTVLSVTQLDVILKSRWNGFRSLLNNQDINGAILNFASDTQDTYKKLYTDLKPILADVASELNTTQINFISLNNNSAIYEILATRNGVTYSFQLEFVRDANGIWKIYKF